MARRGTSIVTFKVCESPKLTPAFLAMIEVSCTPVFEGVDTNTAIYDIDELLQLSEDMEEELSGVDYSLLQKIQGDGSTYVQLQV